MGFGNDGTASRPADGHAEAEPSALRTSPRPERGDPEPPALDDVPDQGGRRLPWRGPLARLIACAVALAVIGGSATWYAVGRDRPATAGTPATSVVDRGAVTAEIAATGTAVPAQTRALGFAVASTVTKVSVRPGDTVSIGQELASVDDTSARERFADAQESLSDARDALSTAEEAAGQDGCAAGTTGGGTTGGGTTGGGSAGSTGGSTGSGGTRSAASAGTADGTGSAGTGSAGTTTAGTGSAGATATGDGSAGGVPLRVVALAATAPAPTPSRTAPPTPQPTSPTTAPTPKPTSNRPQKAPTPTAGPGVGDASGQQDQCTGRTGTDQILSARQRVNSARQRVDEATEQLDGTTVTAPFAGRVLSVGGTVGSKVTAGRTFIELADVNGMQISASFTEADAGRLATGQTAVVTLPARPGKQFTASVVQLDPAGTTSGDMVTYGALLSFTKTPGDMLVGQSANVRVTTAKSADVTRVPATAVREIRNSSGVVMVRTGAGSQRRTVGVGLRGDRYIEITSGLAQGERVLTSW